MKNILLIFVLLLVMAAPLVRPTVLSGREREDPVVVRYDKFKDVTIVETAPNRVKVLWAKAPESGFRFGYVCPGQDSACHPNVILVTYSTVSPLGVGWELMNAPRSIIFLADEKRIAAHDVEWDGLAGPEDIIEWFTGAFSPEEFHQLVNASEIEYQVGSFHRKVNQKWLSAWRALEAKAYNQGDLQRDK
jgi:hypothetical protein